MNDCSPQFSSPIALSIPAGVSQIRGAGLPSRGSTLRLLVTPAPSRDRSTIGAYSLRDPNVPEAAISGPESFSGPSWRERSGIRLFFARLRQDGSLDRNVLGFSGLLRLFVAAFQ